MKDDTQQLNTLINPAKTGFLGDQIKKIAEYKKFCTPGHKGTLCNDDITEVEGAFPLDYIEKAQKETAKYFKADHLRYLTGGSSMGIKAALLSAGNILANAGCHPSIQQAAQLSGVNIYYIAAEIKDGLTLPPNKKQLETALKHFPETQTVVLTAPDYYGLMPDPSVAKAVKKEGLRLHIDGAHAAHFFFRPDLFDTGIFRYADTFNLSAHKTLSAYTQTAYLAATDSEIKRIDQNLSLLGTTSPYYPFLAQLFAAADVAFKERAKYDGLFKAIKVFKKRIGCLKNDDFTRIVVDCQGIGRPAEIFAKLLENGIVAEKFDDRYLIFIVTPCDKTEDIEELAQELLKQGDFLPQ